MEIIESEELKKIGLKKSEKSLRDMWDINKRPTYTLWDSKNEKRQREYLKK